MPSVIIVSSLLKDYFRDVYEEKNIYNIVNKCVNMLFGLLCVLFSLNNRYGEES
jgi:hypothetical protein